MVKEEDKNLGDVPLLPGKKSFLQKEIYFAIS